MITEHEKITSMEQWFLFRAVFNISSQELHKRLDQVQRKAKKRTLSHFRLDMFLQRVEKMVRVAQEHDIPMGALLGDCDEEALPNSYAYTGESTVAFVSGSNIGITRQRARRVSGGDNGRMRVGFSPHPTMKKRYKELDFTYEGGLWIPS